MKTSVESLEPVKVKLTVEVEPERVKRAFDSAARDIAKQVNLPGFRPGKAPRRLLEQRIGKGAIAQQAMENALTEYYVEAIRQEEIDAVSMPEIDMKNFDEDEGCTFEATVEIRPEFEVPDHEGITVTFPEWEVDGEDVEEQLREMRERFAEVDEVERAAEEGDFVTLDLNIWIDGEELEDAAIEDAMYEVGSGGVTPKLDELLVGAEAGDEFDYTDELPESYPEHGGEEADFHVVVKDVRAKTLPELDDDFATTASEFDTIDELREDLERSLQRRRIIQGQHEVRGLVLEAYLAKVDIPLPPSLIEEERDQRIHRLEHQAEQYGLDVEQLLQMQGTSREEFEGNAEQQATTTVKGQLVLDALAQKLEIEVEPRDIDAEIIRHAQTTGVPPEQIAEVIRQQGSIGALVGDVLRRKAIDRIIAAADIEGAPSDELLIELELMADPEAPDEDDVEPAESGLVVPGRPATGGDASELIIPGQ